MANISATLYSNKLEVICDCSGAVRCNHALWEIMPIDDDEHCIHRQHGTCHSIHAQQEAVERLRRRLAAHAKALIEEEA
jgi:hypothetical protein